MPRERTNSKTEANLLVALAGEADANRRYLAYGIRALNEGRADIAQLFFEAAGAETIHALNHLATMGAIGTTRENLELAATGEVEEIEVVLPRMIRETESARIERLSSIREVVFGAQDALVSTFAVVAGLAAAGVGHLVVLLGGLVSAVAGVLAMSIGTFLASRAQRQLYETELERERREIRDHPGEEIAELMAALVGRGMPRTDAAEVARRIARYPELLLSTLGLFELGVAPQQLGTPVRDAFVMAAAFGAASLVPLLPFLA